VKYVLDTNAFSALMRGDAAAVAHLAKVARDEVLVPQPVIAEVAYGLRRLAHSRRRERLEARYELLRGEISRASWTDEVSESFGEIKAFLEKQGVRIEDFDLAIAAHALALGATLVTADVGHMPRIPGVVIEDWTEAG
jgi:tRNA(fMet)-specific endonuclease VapC